MRRDFSRLCNREFDLLVCGGGIYGAWTAYDAALRGLRVAIVEQGDWAGGTSSVSSKLIHGGLRYLEAYDFKLVRKALREREELLKNAPHRVWPLRFGVPIYQGGRIGTLKLKAGLILYDFLAGIPSADIVHRHYNHSAFARRFSFLNDAMLKGGFTYGDAQTDDARLVLELIAGAMAIGAVCVNYCRVTGYREDNEPNGAVTLQDMAGHGTAQINARQVVNAIGPWMAETEQGKSWCRLSKGIHLVMPALPTEEALLLTAKSDGRVFFIIPWYGMSLLGTTDDDYVGDISRIKVEPSEVAYLLDEVNRYLKIPWTAQDVVGSYAGVRAMKRGDSEFPSAVSRDWELKTVSDGMHYSIGGKLTSSRQDAANIVNTVCSRLGITTKRTTLTRSLPWAPKNYTEWEKNAGLRATHLGIEPDCAKWLMRRHGIRIDEIFHIVKLFPGLAGRITPSLPFIYADLLLCARDEMVVHLDDLLRRRMPLLILAKLTKEELQRIATVVSKALGWSEDTVTAEIEACRTR